MNCHDARKLRICCLCMTLGAYKSEVYIAPTVVKLNPEAAKKNWQFAHPRCYMEEMGTAKLLTLSEVELRFIRISDVPVRTMQRILQKVAA